MLNLSCGDEEVTTAQQDSAIPSSASNVVVERPSPGTVKVLDALQDTLDESGGQVSAPLWVDIATLTILKNQEGYKFVMDLSGEPPKQAVEGSTGSQWAINLDTDRDGQRDWSITAASTPEKGWQVLLYNHKTGESLSNALFPGVFLHPQKTIEWTIKPEVIGSPESFNWSALAEEVGIAIDELPQDAWPVGEEWLEYP